MPITSAQYFLAIDPGRDKCGLVVLNGEGEVLQKMVAERAIIEKLIVKLIATYRPKHIYSGDGTGSDDLLKLLNGLAPGIVSAVPERGTTLEARELAWKEQPPKGLWRILPRLFWPTPPDIDAWAAVVIGRRALGK